MIYYIIGATNGVCKFKPKNGLTSAGPLAVLAVDGAPKKIIIDGGKDSKSKLLYVYVDESPAGNIHTVIVSGKLKKLQSNFGGLGGDSIANTGVVSIEGDSPNGQIKISPKADMSYLLLCGGLVNGGYNYSEAYDECWSTQQVLQTVINMGSIKKVKTKSIGPAIFALHVGEKYKNTNKLEVKDVIGIENLVDIQ